MPESSSASSRQCIRPSAKQLATYDADALEWPPSANVSRGVKPPTLASSSSRKDNGQTTGKEREPSTTDPHVKVTKSVRIAEPTEEDVRYYQPTPRERQLPDPEGESFRNPGPSRFKASRTAGKGDITEGGFSSEVEPGRFTLPLDEAEVEDEGRDGSYPRPQLMPMVASVKERPRQPPGVRKSGTDGTKSPLTSGSSRFKAIKEAERRAAEVSPSTSLQSGRPVAPPQLLPATGNYRGSIEDVVHTAVKDDEVLTGGHSDEEWLDESGKPMSAFRKSRLKKQGLDPPGGIVKRKAVARMSRDQEEDKEDEDENANENDVVAGDGDLPSLLQSISRENEERLKAMKGEEITQDLKDLEAMFGKEVLEGLRNRTATKGSASISQSLHKSSQAVENSSSGAKTKRPIQGLPIDDPTAQELRRPSLSRKLTGADMIFFDSQGKAMPISPKELDSHDGHAHAKYGLDSNDPSNEGYNSTSLLLIARSAIPSQRVVALNLLSRVCSLYPPETSIPRASEDDLKLVAGIVPDANVVATWLFKIKFHVESALVSIFLLTDRQRSVRSAALSCLRVSLLFLMPLHGAPVSYSETTSRSTIQRFIRGGLLSGLGNLLRGDEEEQKASRELILQILLQLSRVDVDLCTALLQADRGRFLELLLQISLKMKWPPSEEGPKAPGTSLPSPTCTHLLMELVRSSRTNAEKLVKSGSFDVLLRFVAVPPWTMQSLEGLSEARAIGYELLASSLQLFHLLAQYGFYASLVSRAWEVFQSVHAWASNATFSQPQQGVVVGRFYRLLSIWTVCATDPHQTTPEHEVTWSQAEGWIELSLDGLPSIAKATLLDAHGGLAALIGILSHIDSWLDGAKRNAPERRLEALDQLREILTDLFAQSDLTARITDGLSGYLTVKEREQEEDSDAIRIFADICETASLLLDLTREVQMSDIEHVIRGSGIRLVDRKDELCRSLAIADPEQRLQILSFTTQVIESYHWQIHLTNILALLSSIRSGEEVFAVRLVDACLGAAAEGDPARVTLLGYLGPFYLECLGIRPNPDLEARRQLLHPPIKTRPEHLKRTMSLRHPIQRDRKFIAKPSREESSGDEGENGHEETVDLDPVTKSPLWTCPASGLPLRVDWPLLPLDDLLRSAESSVFNRADNLPPDWDPNERQVVQATLEFTIWILENSSSESSSPSGRTEKSHRGMTPTHVYFAAQKIFMLESGLQGDLKKWTGAVTGKDLFRDPAISPLLGRLLSLANRINVAREEEPTLEDLATAHLGEETTYYSFYTDLVGLYDAISYGDPSFGISLLPPTRDDGVYAVDYRRLLWQDYAHILPTMKMQESQAPGGVDIYLSSVRRSSSTSTTKTRDEDIMLQSYLSSLLPSSSSSSSENGAISIENQPLMGRIALHHIASFLWSGISSVDGKEEEEEEEEEGESLEESQRTHRRWRSLLHALFSSSSLQQGEGGEGGHRLKNLLRVRELIFRYDLRRPIGQLPSTSTTSTMSTSPSTSTSLTLSKNDDINNNNDDDEEEEEKHLPLLAKHDPLLSKRKNFLQKEHLSFSSFSSTL